jgi:hypothetical protein
MSIVSAGPAGASAIGRRSAFSQAAGRVGRDAASAGSGRASACAIDQDRLRFWGGAEKSHDIFQKFGNLCYTLTSRRFGALIRPVGRKTKRSGSNRIASGPSEREKYRLNRA